MAGKEHDDQLKNCMRISGRTPHQLVPGRTAMDAVDQVPTDGAITWNTKRCRGLTCNQLAPVTSTNEGQAITIVENASCHSLKRAFDLRNFTDMII